jgi:proton glutamate symport protein
VPPEPDLPQRKKSRRSLTIWILVALVAGLGLGLALHGSEDPLVARLVEGVVPLGQFWFAALRLIVVPLVVTQTLVAIAGPRNGEAIGTLGLKALVVFVLMLVAGGIFTILVTPPLLALYPVEPATAEALRASTSVPASATEMAGAGVNSFGEWLVGLVPESLPAAFSGREILPLLLVAIVLGLAVNRLPSEPRHLLAGVFQALADTMMVVVRWILVLTPLGIFALSFQMALRAGLEAAGVMLVFAVLTSVMLLAFTAILYPATSILARIPIGRFARAVAPAQLIATATSSSLASLPALVEGARDVLRLPASATGFILPLAVATFKVNRTVSSTVKLLFLAHVFHVPLGAGQIASFLVTVLIMSFSSVGVPGGGVAFRTMPAYLAAGLPIEGVVILEAVDAIPDVFKTITNVTGDMSAAAILSRQPVAPAA